MLRTLSFIALVYNQFEYSLECLRRSNCFLNRLSTTQEREPVYLKFLKQLEKQIEKSSVVYPATFSEKFPSFAMIKSRFEVNKNEITGVRERVKFKKFLRKIPVLFLLLRWILRICRTFRRILFKWSLTLKQLYMRNTNVEALLFEYGLAAQANTLKKNRIIQSHFQKKGKNTNK